MKQLHFLIRDWNLEYIILGNAKVLLKAYEATIKDWQRVIQFRVLEQACHFFHLKKIDLNIDMNIYNRKVVLSTFDTWNI